MAGEIFGDMLYRRVTRQTAGLRNPMIAKPLPASTNRGDKTSMSIHKTAEESSAARGLWVMHVCFLFWGLALFPTFARAQARGAFRADRMDTVLYGVAYYPEYMPYERLDQDVQLMQKAGISVVRIGEFSWGLWEPEDGKFE